jgi:serine protease Do
VTLPDGREFEGKVKGSDPRSDLAIIKIDAENLPVAVLGDSDNVQTGEWVVAIGNPFGHIVDSPEPTVTSGVVSALHRSLPSSKSGYFDLIQTDAAINPGNSGGPLCDLNGRVIGINVAIFSTTGGYQGVGFAIPINVAKKIIDDLIKGKQITYGWIGVVIQDMTDDLAGYFGLTDTEGVLISQVVSGSPAEKGGLRPGDVIIGLNEDKIKSTKDLVMSIGNVPVGDGIEVTVIRNRKRTNLDVRVGKMPTEEEIARMQGRPVEPLERFVAEKWRGIEVFPITREIARRFNIMDKDGVIVVNVEAGSPAFYAGLRQGDIIKGIDNKKIATIEDYRNVIKGLKGDVLIYTDKGFTILKEDR